MGYPLSTYLLRPDLGAVDPARHDVEHGEKPQEHKHEYRGCCAELRRLRRVGDLSVLRRLDEYRDEEERDTLRSEGDDQRLSGADAVDDERYCSRAGDPERVDQS